MFAYEAKLAIVALGISFFAAGIAFIAGAVRVHWSKRQADLEGRVSSFLFQLIFGISKLRVRGRRSAGVCGLGRGLQQAS